MAEIRIYGGIGIPDEYGNVFRHSDLVDFLDSNTDQNITLRINSPGGLVRTGNAIIETLRNSGRKITTVGEEIVGSMATQIFLVGETRQLYPTTEFFLHNVQGGVMGSPDEIEKYLADMKRDNEQLVNFYIDRTGLDRETLQALLDNEVTITGREALQLGFATALIEPVAAYISKPRNDMKLADKIKNLLNGKEVSNDLELSLANGQKIQVSTGEEIAKIGDGVKVEGQTPEDGEYKLADNRAFVVSGGMITDILTFVEEVPAEISEDEIEDSAPEPQEADRMQQLEQRITELEKMLADRTEAMKKEAEDLNASILAMVEHLKKTTSGNVKPPIANAFAGTQTDPRPLRERINEIKKRAGMPV